MESVHTLIPLYIHMYMHTGCKHFFKFTYTYVNNFLTTQVGFIFVSLTDSQIRKKKIFPYVSL